MEYKRHPDRRWRHYLSAPIIYGMIIPLVFLDVCTEIYHHICFPLYGIPLVDRRKYLRFDRFRLPYLNTVQKFNCTYCAYGNGMIKYVTAIIAETEKYWCGIRHRSGGEFKEPDHHKNFLPYDDKKAYQEFIQK